jgi:PAS domain S-box-containing protein
MIEGPETLFERGGEMARRMAAFDWSATPLGPSPTWPQSLRAIVRVMLTSRFAMWMAWGTELTFFCNDAYLPTLGVKESWALGTPARSVWEEIWPDIGPRIDHVLATGQATWDEALLLFLERSGYPEETYHTFSYSPLADEAGQIAGMLCVVTEETDRIIGERRLGVLRDLAAELSTSNTETEVFAAADRCLTRAVKDFPFTLTYLLPGIGADGRLVSSSGISPDSLLAPNAIDFNSAGAPWPIAQLIESGEPMRLPDLSQGFEGLPQGPWSEPPHQAILLPLAQGGQSRPAGAFIAGLNPFRPFDDAYRSFAELVAGQLAASLNNVRAYEAERKRAEALAEIDRAKTTFFSNVSHEFRTPLTLMLGPLLDTLAQQNGLLPPRVAEELTVVHRNGLRLLKLVNTLLDFSRIEAGRVQASFVPTDLAAFTADLAGVFRSAIEKAGLTLVVETSPLGELAYVDRDMWEKIVLNLMSNAFKFTLEGSITVRLAREGQCFRLSVADTGSGIPAAELPRLFERFHRVEGTPGRTHEGSGIGLALVQELVKIHGGAVTAESEIGVGTTLMVALPAGKEHLQVDRIAAPQTLASSAVGFNAYVEEALRWLPESARTGGGDDGPSDALAGTIAEATLAERAPAKSGEPRPRVLVADDNADMRNYLRRLLADRYEVVAVADGRVALQEAVARVPALILSDVMMPGLDGFGLLRAVRAEPALSAVPVVLLSARAGEEATLDGIRAGADDYLVKPFSARELTVRVHALIERKQFELALRRSEERSRFFVELDDALRPISDAVELAHVAARVLAEHFECDRSLYVEVDADEDHCRVTGEYSPDLPSIMGSYRISQYGADYIADVRANRPHVEYDTTRATMSAEERRLFAALGIGAFISAPLFKHGKLVALFVVHDAEPRHWDPHEIEDVSLVANRCWESIERARVTRALIASEERLAVSIEAAELGTFYCPIPLGPILWNDKCKEHFWLPPEAEVDFDRFYSILHADDRERVRLAVDHAVFHRQPYDIEYRTVSPQGRIRWIRAKGRAYYDASGAATRFDGVTLDITELKLAEQRREEILAAERSAREEAERVSRMKDEFLATLSHELRTPLNAILGWSQILSRRPVDEEDARQGLEAIERNARAQTQMIEDLLDMSRIISGKVRLDVQRLVIGDVVSAAVQSVRPSAEVKGVHLFKVVDPYAGPVAGDSSRLQQVVWNLLTNAIKFTPRGGRVQVVLERINSHVQLSVSDTGEGISPEFLPHVFERFRQADSSTTRRHGGLGLGLNIVKQLVELHGGTVHAKSTGKGQGATFSLTLPLAIAELDSGKDGKPGEHPRIAATQRRVADSPDLSGITVLVVEDDADARTMAQRILSDGGASVLAAASAAEALAILKRDQPDVLVSDIGMPGEDGYELIRKVRALPPDSGGDTPAVALTAFVRSEDRQRALRAGYQLHIAKPVEPMELLTVCASLVGRLATHDNREA